MTDEMEAGSRDTLVIETQGRADYGWLHLPAETVEDARLTLGDLGMLLWLLNAVATRDRVAEAARMHWGLLEADRHMRALYQAGYIVMRPDGGLVIHDTTTTPVTR